MDNPQDSPDEIERLCRVAGMLPEKWQKTGGVLAYMSADMRDEMIADGADPKWFKTIHKDERRF